MSDFESGTRDAGSIPARGAVFAGQGTLAHRLDTIAQSAECAHGGALPVCAHVFCELPATDSVRGMPMCRGHLFWAFQAVSA